MFHLAHKTDFTPQAVSAIEAEESFFVIDGISATGTYIFCHGDSLDLAVGNALYAERNNVMTQ